MKTECGITDEILVDYTYDEILDAAKRAEIDTHIKKCEACTARVNQLELVKKAAKNAKIDFPADIWAVHKQGVLRKLAKRENLLMNIKEAFFSFFDVKVYGLAVLILLLTGVGLQYYKIIKASQEQKTMAEQQELLQNFEIIQRLDFYEKISQK